MQKVFHKKIMNKNGSWITWNKLYFLTDLLQFINYIVFGISGMNHKRQLHLYSNCGLPPQHRLLMFTLLMEPEQ